MITKENGGTSKRFAKKFLALRFEHFVQRMQNDPKELRSRYPEWFAGVTDKEYARICDEPLQAKDLKDAIKTAAPTPSGSIRK